MSVLWLAGLIGADFSQGAREVLLARLVDRAIRPLFPLDHMLETQVNINLLCSDGRSDADVLAINGASAAMCVSNVRWLGPIGYACAP